MPVRIYCGKSRRLPNGYGRYGTRYECLQCGYGSAMSKYTKRKRNRNRPEGCFRPAFSCFYSSKTKRWVWIVAAITTFILSLFVFMFVIKWGWLESVVLSLFLGLVAGLGIKYIVSN